uniref:Beta-lactamase n=1 Tax=Globisporangium ultimum (strain ATCC 200006 / CBS 805.95 / DAOM BR144) TaxID=431595 RepID=K3X1Y0_GLOUD
MVLFSNDRSAEEVKRVNQQLEERHYEFRSNCNDGDGDASACHSWGEWLAVVDKNYSDAATMYKQNCDKNNYAASCFNLGRLKLAGKGVEMNDVEAANLFEKSCDGGHAQGCHHLGIMFMNGAGRDKDVTKGLEAFKRACDHDEANSCNRVASMYLSATAKGPIKRDVPLAKQYLEKACDMNFAPACHNLAVMYKNGDEGVAQSEEKFEEYRKKTSMLIAEAGGMSGVKGA